MKTLLRLLLFVLLCAFAAQAQTTSVSGTITAADSQTYNNGTYTFQLTGQGPFYLGGVLMTLAQTTITGALDSGGSFTSVAVGKTASISPAGTTWLFTTCPLSSSPCWSQNIGIVSGTTLNISSTITPPAIKVTPTPNVLPLAYNDSEIQGPQVGTNYYNLTSAVARICISISGVVCTWSSEGAQAVSSVFGRTGAVAATKGDYTAGQVTGAMPQFASYNIFLATDSTCTVPSATGTSVCARNNSTGAFDYNSTDLAVVFNDITVASGTAGGHLKFNKGVYPINSMTVESTTGCSTFDGSSTQLAYGIQFPSNTPYFNGVQWYIEGETSQVWQGEEGSTTAATTGVIFNVTPTAVSSVTAGDILAGFWQRPVTNCTLTATNTSNDIIFQNVTMRFPLNTRGNEVAFAMYFAADVEYGPSGIVVADYAQPYNTIATGSAPTVGTWNSVGMTSSVSSAGNWQDFRNTYVVGSNLAYDFQSEHITGQTITAIYNNIACEFGRSGTAIFHPINLANAHFVDQENGAGCIWGPQMQQGTMTDIGFDFEFGNDANWYSTARGKTTKLSETNNGYSTGIIRYQAVLAGTGVTAEIPAASLFTSGGVNMQGLEGTNPPNLALVPISDTFTRPNASTLGPAWLTPATCNGGNPCLKLNSNSAQVVLANAAAGYAMYGAQPFNNDQFSKATCSTLAATADFCEVLVRSSSAAQTYYTYYDGGTNAAGRGIIKVVAGVSTTLASQTSAAGAAADVLELDVVGNTLWAYRNGGLDTSFTNPVTDSSITAGSPGILIVDTSTASTAMTNWSGGNFPTKTGTDSIYNNPAYATMYLSKGTPPTPTGTGACATITTQVPASIGSTAGTLKCTGTTGASTITLTFPAAQAAPNGWRCSADDETTVADRPNQTSSTNTTCVLTSAATAQNDVIIWNASPF